MNGWLKWDGEILLWIQEHVRAGGLNGAMRAITHLGDAGAFWILLAVALLIVKRTRRLGAACASALAMGALATNVLLKNLVHRIRPYVSLENLSILVSEPSDWSFPSGHATASFAAAWALFRLAPKKVGVPALLLAILIALSRLYVGVHYPTDVLAGAAIGILSGEISARLIRNRRVSRLFENDSCFLEKITEFPLETAAKNVYDRLSFQMIRGGTPRCSSRRRRSFARARN